MQVTTMQDRRDALAEYAREIVARRDAELRRALIARAERERIARLGELATLETEAAR